MQEIGERRPVELSAEFTLGKSSPGLARRQPRSGSRRAGIVAPARTLITPAGGHAGCGTEATIDKSATAAAGLGRRGVAGRVAHPQAVRHHRPRYRTMEHVMADDDLGTLVRELRTSVSDDLSATHRQMAELSDEVRARITTAETAILNAVRDLGRDVDPRLSHIEKRLSESDGRLKRIEDAQQG